MFLRRAHRAGCAPLGRFGTQWSVAPLLLEWLVIIQLWLLSATLDAALSGEVCVAIPASIVSLLLFACSAGLLWYVIDFDRRRSRAASSV